MMHRSVAARRVGVSPGGGGGSDPSGLLRRRQPHFFGLESGAGGDVGLTVKVQHAIHNRLLTDTRCRKRTAAPDNEVGVFARFQAAGHLVDMQLFRRVDRDKLQRLDRVNPAPVDRFRRFQVQATGQFGIIRVERDYHAPLIHQRPVVGNRVPGFDLECPPVRERRCPRAVLRNLVGDLVAFQNMLECRDPETKLLGKAYQHQNLILTVRMAVDQALAIQNLDYRIQLQIAPGRSRQAARLVERPLRFVVAGL